jgi:hypothetical protein
MFSSLDGNNRALPIGSATNIEQPSDLDYNQSKTQHFIDRSTKIARAEDDLFKALSIFIVDDTTASPVDALTTKLAHRYDLLVEVLELHHLGMGGFLLILFDEAATLRVQVPPFRVV